MINNENGALTLAFQHFQSFEIQRLDQFYYTQLYDGALTALECKVVLWASFSVYTNTLLSISYKQGHGMGTVLLWDQFV